jgi:hypothetical protein
VGLWELHYLVHCKQLLQYLIAQRCFLHHLDNSGEDVTGTENIKPIQYIYQVLRAQFGGRLSSGKYVGTACLRAAGSSPAPPAVWVFWRLIRRTESLDRGLILVCRFSFINSRERIPVAAQTHSCLQGWMHVRNPLLLPNGQAIVTA